MQTNKKKKYNPYKQKYLPAWEEIKEFKGSKNLSQLIAKFDVENQRAL